MSLKTRTEGDGMETISPDENKREIPAGNQQPSSSKNTKHSKKRIVFTTHVSQSYPDEYFPMDKLINLTPKEIHYVNRKSNSLSREPKFVPYEPYKAAIKPIISTQKRATNTKKRKSKNNLDLSVLVSQMSLIDTNPIAFKSSKRPLTEILKEKKVSVETITDNEKKVWELEKAKMQDEIRSLKNTNVSLIDQIKQQAHVSLLSYINKFIAVRTIERSTQTS